MNSTFLNRFRSFVVRQRYRLRSSEAALIGLATLAGLASGVTTNVQQALAHGLQRLFYGITINRLSALGSIHHPWRLAALPLGGLVLIAINWWAGRRPRAPIDVVEANALHGGRIPFFDNLLISAQTIVSNGAGASVGLEAAYAQLGGGIASQLGQWLRLRRNDLRTLVGAGAGSAVGAAFGAPLTGAFYGFEIVIGSYTPAAIAPVMAAALAAAFVTRQLGVEPYLIATTAVRSLGFVHYLAYAGLGAICAVIGIEVMRLVTTAEEFTQTRLGLGRWRPLLGGILLVPIALVSPQTLSAGHGALHLDMMMQPALSFLFLILALKILASVVSLSMGFRGGLFFASMFLGSLVGQIFGELINASGIGFQVDLTDAALVGMAAFSVTVVGGPMTLALLMLETTHDFALMGVVLTAALIASALTREMFGYSFSTWRLHMRGTRIRSPRDIGWVRDLTAKRVMRRDWIEAAAAETIGSFRARVPLGRASKAIALDEQGRYAGIVSNAIAHARDQDPQAPIGTIASLADTAMDDQTDAQTMLDLFDQLGADELVVVDNDRRVIGVVTEKYLRRRYFEQIELAQRELYGETG